MKANEKNVEFYKDKKVFVTGHTGYKGAWLTAVLHMLGAKLTGYSLEPSCDNMFRKINGEKLGKSIIGDVRDFEYLKKSLLDAQPEIVIHLAAQAIVNDCFLDPRCAYETNVMGTVNLLEAIRLCPSVKSVVIITTDKVYENKGDGAVYVETDCLGGIDPYSSSKTCMEYVVDAYKNSYLQAGNSFVGIATVRASNVLGGGDCVKSRLIPSILEAISNNKPIELRHPHQTRPWQSMMDALNGYLSIGRLLYNNPSKYSQKWNIGPSLDGIKEVVWVVDQMRKHYNSTEYIVGNSFDVVESKTLGLDITKALKELDWEPLLSCDKMLYSIVEYYKKQQEGVPELDIAEKQIREFFEL